LLWLRRLVPALSSRITHNYSADQQKDLKKNILFSATFTSEYTNIYLAGLHVACLHDQNKSGFLEGRLLSRQSEQFEKLSKSSIGWKKVGPSSKKATFVLIM